MKLDLAELNGKEMREFMEAQLDYEIRGSHLYPLFDLLSFCGFMPALGRYFGWKVNKKARRVLRRPTEIDAIVSSRPDGGYFY